MSEPQKAATSPPKLLRSADGPEMSSLADVLEWFLNFDERTARLRHPYAEELFQWKQIHDKNIGVAVYPFENAEARFAVGVFQALGENNTEALLNGWISDILNALSESKQTKTELTETYGLDAIPEDLAIAKSEKLTTNAEKKLYLTSCWIEVLCTAEARFLGWVYQELYGKPFEPAS